MVKLTTIRQSNVHFASERHTGLVCVFAGATSGIGASTLERTISMLQDSTFYVIGRSAARFATQRARLRSVNPSCSIVFLEAEVSRISDVDEACKQIIAAEQRVDFLYMSPGLYPLNRPEYTEEGLETCFALSYYCRMRMVSNILPLLRRSTRPRVLSVLNGGREKRMRDEDLGLEQHWSPRAVINHTTTMTSLAFQHLAVNEEITFLHAFPGLVRTDIFARLTAPDSSGLTWSVILACFRGFIAVAMLFLGVSADESGERQAYHLTNDTYGSGVRLIGSSSDLSPKPSVLDQYQVRGWPEKVWEHTVCIFERRLSSASHVRCRTSDY